MAGLVWYILTCLQGPLQALPVGPAGHPPEQLGDRPFPHGRPRFFGDHRPGRHLLHPAPHHRTADLQRAPGRYPVLAGAPRHGRILHGPDRRRAHPGKRLAERRDGLSDSCPRSMSTWCCGPAIGVLLVGGAVIGLYNVVMTPLRREALAEEVSHEDDPARHRFGGLIIFTSVLFIAVILPWTTISEQPSDIYPARTALEDGPEALRRNGCTYCHTQFIRNIDWDLGAERIAQSGDYVQRPAPSARDRTDRPGSLPGGRRAPGRLACGPLHQPPLHPAGIDHARLGVFGEGEHQGPDRLQAEPGLQDGRLPGGSGRTHWKEKADQGLRGRARAERRLAALHGARALDATFPTRTRPREAGLQRGHRIYQSFCIGCHGPDRRRHGAGPALPLSAAAQFHASARTGGSRAASSTTRS